MDVKPIDANHEPDRRGLDIRNLQKGFSNAEGRVEILRDLNLEVGAGSSVAIIGPSGSGKSTLLHLVGTLDQPDHGTIRLADIDITALASAELARFRSRHVGFIFQDHHLLPQMTVLENVLIPILADRRIAPEDDHRARELLFDVGLQDRLHHRPGQLSGGQRERVAIARALINRPDLILADEPTGNLDRRTAEQVALLLGELPKRHQAVLVTVTHSSDLAEAMDRRYELIDGRLTAAG